MSEYRGDEPAAFYAAQQLYHQAIQSSRLDAYREALILADRAKPLFEQAKAEDQSVYADFLHLLGSPRDL